MDTAVAAYLLDPSSDDYRLDAVAGTSGRRRYGGGPGGQGQLALGGLDGDDDRRPR